MDTHPLLPFKSTLPPPLPGHLGGGKEDIVAGLPVEHRWVPGRLRKYQSFWIPDQLLTSVIAMQQHFTARPTDILLATPMKCGTTWLKALTFAAATRHLYPLSHHPLLTVNPHECFYFLEGLLMNGQAAEVEALRPPRLIATHLPHSLLPESVNSSACRIVYLCRDPKDSFVSLCHFRAALRAQLPGLSKMEPIPLEEAFQLYCEGISSYGPFWDHNLGYWKESVSRPERVLFLKYEEMMEEPAVSLRRLAEFLGFPFSDEEERKGVVQEIVTMCSFEKMRSLQVNRIGSGMIVAAPVKFSSFFRKGKVGDWVNHLTPEMGRKLDGVANEKLEGSGLILPGVRSESQAEDTL